MGWGSLREAHLEDILSHDLKTAQDSTDEGGREKVESGSGGTVQAKALCGERAGRSEEEGTDQCEKCARCRGVQGLGAKCVSLSPAHTLRPYTTDGTPQLRGAFCLLRMKQELETALSQ